MIAGFLVTSVTSNMTDQSDKLVLAMREIQHPTEAISAWNFLSAISVALLLSLSLTK